MSIQVINTLNEEQRVALEHGIVAIEAKAMNRTALGIVAGIFKVYPKLTFAELKEMLPDTLNPSAPKNYKSLFKPYTQRLYGVVQSGSIREECTAQGLDINASHFTEPDEVFKTSDGVEVLVSRTWESSDSETGKNDLHTLINHVAPYGIKVVTWESQKNIKRGEYSIEVINPNLLSQIHSAPKKSFLWLWILLLGIVAASVFYFA
jgi:hypothetical protein